MQGGRYRTYGHECDVNFDWSWCTPGHADVPADLRVELGGLGRFEGYPRDRYAAHAVRPGPDPAGPPTVLVERALDGHTRIAYADGAEFVIDATGTEIFGASRSALTLDDLVVYLQGPVLGLALRLRGITCLHASAVVIGDAAVVVVGDAGMGKSTSAAAFAGLGLAVLTDDVTALRDAGPSLEVEPGPPRVMLWPEAVASLFGAPDALPRVVAGWDKRYLSLGQARYRFAARATRVGAVYVLADRVAGATETAIGPLAGARALAPLVASTYAHDFVGANERAQELGVLGRLVREAPVRWVRAPEDVPAPTRVCEAIMGDYARIG